MAAVLRESACGPRKGREEEEMGEGPLTRVTVGGRHVQGRVSVLVASFAERSCAEAVDEGFGIF